MSPRSERVSTTTATGTATWTGTTATMETACFDSGSGVWSKGLRRTRTMRRWRILFFLFLFRDTTARDTTPRFPIVMSNVRSSDRVHLRSLARAITYRVDARDLDSRRTALPLPVSLSPSVVGGKIFVRMRSTAEHWKSSNIQYVERKAANSSTLLEEERM
ncbi:uncharacterized protein LOC105428189 isoform X2 [Pogonomyrmex barbatus]|uniref:Uncharacterized protein LOC105428189 isoform X2 n=1 Tax=Pogonomyrmex barbatus TaxID=144034 RepID=A0A6I9WHA7_9HYME|nr:uncharacterized protein LOC105428189 isoform X2 [Pogonomyrmex barbatus]